MPGGIQKDFFPDVFGRAGRTLFPENEPLEKFSTDLIVGIFLAVFCSCSDQPERLSPLLEADLRPDRFPVNFRFDGGRFPVALLCRQRNGN